MKTKLYSSKDPNKKPKVSGAIWSVVTAPFWLLAGVGCILCIVTAGLILGCYDLIKSKQ